jgi:hypothetical protein
MSWRAVEVEIIFLDVLAVIALAIGQAEQPLLENRVLAVPQRHGKAQPLMVVTETGETVLAPMIGAGARLIVGKIIPRISVLAVVLANGAPLALAKIRPPLLPRHSSLSRLVETQLLHRLPAFWASLVRQQSPPV